MTRILTTLAVALLMASPAAAEHERRAETDMERLMRVAHRLQNSVDRVCEHALRDLRRHNPRQHQVLSDLDYLGRRSQRFNQRLDKYAYRPHKLRREIKRLNAAYVQAESSLNQLRHAEHLKRDFAQVGRLMDRVQHRYHEVLVAKQPRRQRGEGFAHGGSWELARRWSYAWR